MNIALLKHAKAALIIFALSLVTTFSVIAVLIIHKTQEQQDIQKIKKQLIDVRENIAKFTLDLKTAEQSAEQYRRLNQLGFIGDADRNGWVQRLDSIYLETHLPPTLRYTLAPPSSINSRPARADDPAAYLNNVLHHDLTFELSNINDQEFLDFMKKLATDWHAPYRVEACQISRETDSGLQIKCTLQLYSLPAKQ